MNLDRLQKSCRTYKRLLESDTLGSFDFFTCIVCLDSIDSEAFDRFLSAIKTKDYSILSKVMPLAVHEFTHFIDSTSTVWGMKHLHKMDLAYSSNNVRGGTESEFYKAKMFLEHVRSLRLPKYYTLIDNAKIPSKPWRYRFTIGKQFGLDGKLTNNPILFTWFENNNGGALARSPISTVSILEASAMSNEMVARLSLIDGLDTNSKVVENSIYQQEAISYIYNQKITEYSVCVHMVANHLACKDLFVAFRICSVITRIVLNFPESLLSHVLESNISQILKIPEGNQFELSIRAGVENHNLGVLYFLICMSLPKNTAESYENMVAGIGVALGKLGLTLDQIEKEAGLEINKIAKAIESSGLKAIRALSKAGLDNFQKISLNTSILNFSELSLPSIYLGDGKEVFFYKSEENMLKDITLDEIFNELHEGQEWVERFSEACTA